MAINIIWVKELGTKRHAHMDEKGTRTYERVWSVQLDQRIGDSVVARDAPGVPVMFDFYKTVDGAGATIAVDHDALVIEKEAKEDSENPFLWEVSVKYSSDAGDPNQGNEDPLQRPAIYKWTNEAVKRPAEVDLDGVEVWNSAKMSYDPPPEYDVAFRVLTITRNEQTFDPAALDRDYAFRVNKDSFFGYPAGAGRMEPIDGDCDFFKGTPYWKVTYVVKFRDDEWGWYLNPLDQGPCYLQGGKPVAFVDQNGAALNGPTLLDGHGDKLDILHQNPVYFHYRMYDHADFSLLNLEPGP